MEYLEGSRPAGITVGGEPLQAPGPLPLDPATGGASQAVPNGAAAPMAWRISRHAMTLPGRARALTGAAVLWAILAVLLILPMGFFLVQAFSPRLLGQGTAWFTLANLQALLSGGVLQGLVDSLWVSGVTALIATAIGFGLAWGVHRTNLWGRRAWSLLVWALLLMPTFLAAEGWEYLLQPHGVLAQFGIDSAGAYDVFFGPAGVVLVLSLSAVPFAYMAVSAALLNLGSEFEEAARVHGAGVLGAMRMLLPILAPALLSAVAISFAESMSDFGVASTLAASANFPVATYVLFQAVNNNPADFGLAAAVGWLLVASAAIPIAVQGWAMRGRSYAVFSGRSRAPARMHLRRRVQVIAGGATLLLFVIALGAPVLGAFVASMLRNFGSSFTLHALTLDNYAQVFQGSRALEGQTNLLGPLLYSTEMALVTAVVVAFLGLAMARLLTSRTGGGMARVADLVLLGSVALPGIVLAAGYIFAYNLPLAGRLGLDLYETTPLLAMGYIATALPSQARLMVGPVSLLQDSLVTAARVHGSSVVSAWGRAVLPTLSRVLLWAGLLTFAKTLLELPVSQLLYPPGSPPISVAINNYIAGYYYGEGTAMTVMALGEQFAVILLALGLFRLLAPRGWQRVGGPTG